MSFFSLSHVTHRDADRFRPVDGLRAISVLWMIVFHCIYHLGDVLPRERFLEVLRSPWLRVLEQGHLGVDIFFVISGFLITSLLLREREARGRVDFRGFYIRRAFRILPAYAIALCLAAWVLGPEAHLASAWSNLLFVNNFLPIARQALPWTWSLAIEEQFYLVFPLSLAWLHARPGGERRAVLACTGLIAVGFAINYGLVVHHGITVPPPLHATFGAEGFARYFDGVYDKTYARYGGLLVGVLAAYLARSSGVVAWFARRSGRAGLALALAVLATIVLQPMVLEPGRVIPPLGLALYLASYRTVFSLAVGYVLLHVWSRGNARSRVARALSADGWTPFSELSYGAYLLHPLVIISVYRWLPFGSEATAAAIALRIAVVYAATLSASFVLFSLVERPLREEGRRLARSLTSRASQRMSIPNGQPAQSSS
jgi:peptidoglycan/LPS O-acetylase OafA/YrhL